MPYTLTGSPVQPAQVAYRAFTLSANTTLYWPFANSDADDVASLYMNVQASTGGLSLTMPAANQVSVGYAVIIENSGANNFSVLKNDGSSLVTSATGTVIYIIVSDNTTVAGVWRSVNMGSGTTTANASTLAGQGLEAIAGTLNVDAPVNSTNTTYQVTVGDRGEVLNWTGGVGTANLDAAATLGQGFYFFVRNSGSGVLTLDPNSSETINGVSTLALDPGDSTIVICNGTAFYTVGLGQAVVNTDSRLSKNVAGSSNVTLTTSEAENNIINFTGTLTGNIDIIFPNTVREYTLTNSTNGAFTITFKTAAGTGITIPQGESRVAVVDGTNMIYANDSGSGTVTSITAGTGLSGGVITTSGTIAIANTGVSAGSYGSSTAIPVLTFNAQGQATAASTASVSGIFTGMSIDWLFSTLPSGFIWADGQTIGSATSGATNRANADTQALYEGFWNSYSNTILPIQDSSGVPTTRGVDAATDFAANKRLPVPDLRGRTTVGRDNMGGTSANRLTVAGCGFDGDVLGASGGVETVALTGVQTGPHTHTTTVNDPGHFHTTTIGAGGGTDGVSGSTIGFVGKTTGSATTGITVTVNSGGSGDPHQNTQPSWVVNKIIKL